MKHYDFITVYPHPWQSMFGKTCEARIRVYDVIDGSTDKKLVLISPAPGWEGLSITNGSEAIATHLSRLGFGPDQHIYVEHYPAEDKFKDKAFGKPSFVLVEYDWVEKVDERTKKKRWIAKRPHWRYLGAEKFEQMTRARMTPSWMMAQA